MKKILIFLLLIFSLTVRATNYYVSTTGSDGAAGSIGSPWATWQKGFTSIAAGDILYIRGGIYTPATATVAWSLYDCAVYVNNIDGTSVNKISVFNYPGETPILDCSAITSGSQWRGIFMPSCDYWHIKGIRITKSKGFGLEILGGVLGGNNNIIEQCIFDHNFGSGFLIQGEAEGNLIKNCDSYANFNSPLGDDSDGFEISFLTYRAGTPRVNTLRGCRSWFNSDDGVDNYKNDGTLIVDSCWFWGNGYAYGTTTVLGDGNGLKPGPTLSCDGSLFQRTITNCMVFYNQTNGIIQNLADVKMYLYNNTVYHNGNAGFIFSDYNLAHVFRNNISFSNPGDDYYSSSFSNAVIDHNSYSSSWQPTGPVVTSADFVSVDTTGVSGSRQSNGSLPILNFLRLKSTSALINIGVDVGIPFYGTSPDLGAYEWQGYRYLIINGKLQTIIGKLITIE